MDQKGEFLAGDFEQHMSKTAFAGEGQGILGKMR